MTNVYFDNLNDLIKRNLIEAKYDIKIAVAWITDVEIIYILEKCLDKGVSVNIIFFNDNINRIENFRRIFDKGAKISYTSNLMHNKFCIIDSEKILNGSYNWTNAAKSNNENIQITDSQETALKFEEEFYRILKKSQKVNLYFENKINLFNDYYEKIIKPLKYPVFYKIELDNAIIRNAICEVLNDNSASKGLEYVYKLFHAEDELLTFYKRYYDKLYTKNGIRNIPILSRVNLINGESYVNRYGRTNAFLAIDLLNEENISGFTTLTSVDYVKMDKRFSNEKIIYIDDIYKIKFLIIEIYKKESNLEYKLLISSLTKYNDYYNLQKFEFQILTKDKDNIIVSNKEVEKITSRYEGLFSTVEHKHFININSFEYNSELSINELKKQRSQIEYSLVKKYNEEKETKRKKELQYKERNECYIATMVYSDENHFNIIKLRDFRDKVLLKNFLGRLFIKNYYKFSPWLVIRFKDNIIIKKIIQFFIERIILRFI